MTVKHRFGSYEVSLGEAKTVLDSSAKSFVFTDENVFASWRSLLPDEGVFVMPAGEQSKSLLQFGNCLTWLADNRATRDATFIAFGGGVIGDLAGYVAASYMRGVKYVQVPSTLLSMVDSSVGGKVAIDLPQGKNLVGAFYPPHEVVIDLRLLSTLPEREFINGMAEIWKYGAILDWRLFEQLEAQPLKPGDKRLPEIVMHCVDLKRQVVEADEFETTGLRSILNFGHTIGHAIEKVTGYARVLHGEAIAQGMVVEAAIGEAIGLTPSGFASRIKAGVEKQGLPLNGKYEATALLEATKLDKKASGKGLAFALLTGYGSCKLVPDVPEKVVLECLREHL